MWKIVGVVILAVLGAGCIPVMEAAPPPYRTPQPVELHEPTGRQTVPAIDVHGGPLYGWLAVEEFFGDAGPSVLACAHRIAERESHHMAGSENPAGYHGLFQLGDHFAGTLGVAAINLGQWPWWWSARQSAFTARLIYNVSGFAPWGGC